jgi:predicted DNA-binding transcriptional regulator YafY
MPRRDTAADRLNRILYILPAAGRPGGVALADVAAALGVDAKRIARDVTEGEARSYYMPAGQAQDAQLLLSGDSVVLDPPSEFRRPGRLTLRETAVLVMGLRSMAVEASAVRRRELLELAGSLEGRLGFRALDAEPPVLAVNGDRRAGDVYESLRIAARDGRVCALGYLKAGAMEPEHRVLDPYALLFAERWWYVVGRCHARDDVRLFRLDRIVEVEPQQERFERPVGFDPKAYAPGGRAIVSADAVEARVRYGPRVARWIRERYPDAEAREDGSMVVRHAVADPRWLVRQVLQYGRDAEVLEPGEMRGLVVSLAGSRSPSAQRTLSTLDGQ